MSFLMNDMLLMAVPALVPVLHFTIYYYIAGDILIDLARCGMKNMKNSDYSFGHGPEREKKPRDFTTPAPA